MFSTYGLEPQSCRNTGFTVLNGPRNRGVKDIIIALVDGLNVFIEATNAAFPDTEIQRFMIHQIRSSMRCISYKDAKEYAFDMKPIYKKRLLKNQHVYFTAKDFVFMFYSYFCQKRERHISSSAECRAKLCLPICRGICVTAFPGAAALHAFFTVRPTSDYPQRRH